MTFPTGSEQEAEETSSSDMSESLERKNESKKKKNYTWDSSRSIQLKSLRMQSDLPKQTSDQVSLKSPSEIINLEEIYEYIDKKVVIKLEEIYEHIHKKLAFYITHADAEKLLNNFLTIEIHGLLHCINRRDILYRELDQKRTAIYSKMENHYYDIRDAEKDIRFLYSCMDRLRHDDEEIKRRIGETQRTTTLYRDNKIKDEENE